jgi:ABC-2 type transport system permease protein
MAFHFIRVVVATAKMNLTVTWRFFNWTGFALRFFMPIMTIGSAWILFNHVYRGALSPQFESASGYSDYISFITIGNAFYVFVFAAAFVVGRVMFWDRVMGTIEATLICPMSRLAYMAGVMLAAAINSIFDFVAVFFIGIPFGFRVASFNAFFFFSSMLLTALALFGIGLATNAITLILRDRTTASNTLMNLFMVFSGIVCPVSLMPYWARMISRILPLTYGLDVMRASVLGIATAEQMHELLILLILAVVYIGIGILALRLVERHLKKRALLSVF